MKLNDPDDPSPRNQIFDRPAMKQLLISDLQTLIPGPPVEVGVTMYVLSISSVSEVLMVLNSLQIYYVS